MKAAYAHPDKSNWRRDRLIQEQVHDTYRMRKKPPENSVCPQCAAVYSQGRWRWKKAAKKAPRHLCPACLRMADHYPGGVLDLTGPFLESHREEIVNLARHVEERAIHDHPLRRIMVIQDQDNGMRITTTDMGLARDIGVAIHAAYAGELDYRYAKEDCLLRVAWTRDNPIAV